MYDYLETTIRTGTYSWNEGAKTVTLKPESVLWDMEDGVPAKLVNAAQYRAAWQGFLDSLRSELGEADFNAMLLEETGFSSAEAFIDAAVNDGFSNWAYDYSFSTNGNALFLDDQLPANKGSNQLTDQTYYGAKWDNVYDKWVKDEDKTFEFTASGFKYIMGSSTITGSYAYDSGMKRVWLKPAKIDGKDKDAYFADEMNQNVGDPDAEANSAGWTNGSFSLRYGDYDTVSKVIKYAWF